MESELMIISSVDAVHPPLAVVIVQRSVDDPPTASVVTSDVGEFTLLTTAVPVMTVHVPVSPPPTALAFSVAVSELQRSWSRPASEIVVVGSELMIISSADAAQPPLEVVIVHLKVDEPPMVRLFTTDVGELMLVTTAVPEMTDHVPVSLALTAFATRIAVSELQRF